MVLSHGHGFSGSFHSEANEAIRGSVLRLIRLVFSQLVGSYLLYLHYWGVVTNSRHLHLPGRVFQSGGVAGTNSWGSRSTTQSGIKPTPCTYLKADRQGVDGPAPETLVRLDQLQGFTVMLILLKALNSVPGWSTSL